MVVSNSLQRVYVVVVAAFVLLCASVLAGCAAPTASLSSASSASSATASSEAASSASSSASSAAGEAANAIAPFTIIHTNDTHGYIKASEEGLGLAAVAQLKKDMEAEGTQVLLMDAGDVLQGNTLVNQSQGAVVPELMNMVGYDVMALGNHEFDYGPDILEERMKACDFPVLAANITVDETGELFAPASTTFALEDGTKLGVFALDTPSTKTQSSPKNTVGLTFAAGKDLYACAQEQADALRADGCQLVVCLAHLGEESEVADSKASLVAENTSGIDVFIDAHDHQVESQTVKNAEGKDILIAETGSYLSNIGVLTYENGTWSDRLIAVGEYEGADEAITKRVDEIAAEVDKALSKVVGSTTFALNGDRAPGNRTQETNHGDFLADAFLWQAQRAATKAPDAAIVNGGSVRTGIAPGDITLRNIIDTQPFDNQLCTLQVTGAQLLEALEAATYGLPEPMGSFPQVAGITYTVDLSVPYEQGEAYPSTTYFAPANPGARVHISDVGGKGFDPEATYTVAMADFLAYGGDTYYCFTEASQSIEFIGYSDAQAYENYLVEEHGGVVPDTYMQPQGRATVLSAEAAVEETELQQAA